MIKHSYIVSNKIKKEKGITLTALVITIIILLILAGIGISVGRDTIESAKLMSFGTELQAMQHKVNELQQELQNKKKNSDNDGADRIKNIGQELQNTEQENLAFAGAEIEEKSGYKYYDKNTVKELGFNNFNSEFLVNVEKRKVISLYGIQYRGKTIWTVEELEGNDQYNVEYAGIDSIVTFDLESKYNKIYVNNIQYTGNVKKGTIYYGKEKESNIDWKIAKKDTTDNNYTIEVLEEGKWNVKIIDSAGNESEIKETMVAMNYVKTGLILHYDAINNTGNGHSNTAATWYDISGNGNHGMLNGIDDSSESGWHDDYIQLDGIDDYISSSLNTESNFTVEIVASNIEAINLKGYGGIFCINSWAENAKMPSVLMYIGKAGILHRALVPAIANSGFTEIGLYPMIQNKSGFYTMTKNENYIKSYYNSEINSTNVDNSFINRLDMKQMNVEIGRWYNNPNHSVKEKIYSFRIYNRALTDEEINKNYNIDKNRFDIKE